MKRSQNAKNINHLYINNQVGFAVSVYIQSPTQPALRTEMVPRC